MCLKTYINKNAEQKIRCRLNEEERKPFEVEEISMILSLTFKTPIV